MNKYCREDFNYHWTDDEPFEIVQELDLLRREKLFLLMVIQDFGIPGPQESLERIVNKIEFLEVKLVSVMKIILGNRPK